MHPLTDIPVKFDGKDRSIQGSVWVVSRGGRRQEIRVEGLRERTLITRWPNFAGVREFSLDHGCIESTPRWNWKWRLSDEDLAAIRAALGIAGALNNRPRQPAPPKGRPPKADKRQRSMFE